MTTDPASLLPAIACDLTCGGCGVTSGLCVYTTGPNAGKPRAARYGPHKCRVDDSVTAARWYDRGVSAGAASRQPDVDAARSRAASAEASLQSTTTSLQQVTAQLQQSETALADYRASHPDVPPPIDDEVLLELDLSKVPLGQLTAAGASLAFGTKVPGNDTTWKTFSVVADPDGRRWLRYSMAKGAEGSSAGISLAIALSRRVDDATMNGVARVSPGLVGIWGLKFPGLSMTIPGGRGTEAGGGVNPGETAASDRWMLDGPSGTYAQPDGTKRKPLAPFEASDYVYQNGKVEQHRFTGFVPKPGVPFALSRRVAMNSFTGSKPNADGVLQSRWADEGQPLAPGRDDMVEVWRTRPDLQVSHLFWSQFPGGANGDARWAAPAACYVDFADGFTVTTPA